MKAKIAEVKDEAPQTFEFVRLVDGTRGVRMYPAPKGSNEDDLVLRPGAWVHVPADFARSLAFVRDRKLKIFETLRAAAPPASVDMAPSDGGLDPAQRELARQVVLEPGSDLAEPFRSAVALADLLLPNGRPARSGVSETLTPEFLKDKHARFLAALAELERRHRARPKVLRLIADQQKKIERLPGGDR